MNNKTMVLTVCALLAFFTFKPTYAGVRLSKEEAVKLLRGNTLEGNITKWGTVYKMYLHSSGKLVRQDSKGNIERGLWRINAGGKFCIEFKFEKCRSIKKRDDGGLNFYNSSGKLKFTVERIVPGNPNHWQP